MIHLFEITSFALFLILAFGLAQCQEQSSSLWTQKSDSNDYLYVGIYSPRDELDENLSGNYFIQNFLRIHEKLAINFNQRYGIQLGFFDCEFFAEYPEIYESKFKADYCSETVEISDKIFIFNEEDFLYEMEGKTITQMELFQANILETRIQQVFDLVYLTDTDNYQSLLGMFFGDDKSNQDIVLINLSGELNEKTFKERVSLFETVYKHAVDNRFIFVYDQEVYKKIKEDFEVQKNVNMILFLCKNQSKNESSSCPTQFSIPGDIKNDLLVKLLNKKRRHHKLEYDGDLSQLFDQTCQHCSLIIFFYQTEDENLQEFQKFASNKSDNVVTFISYKMTGNKIPRIDQILDESLNSFMGIYDKDIDVFERLDLNLLELEDLYQRLVSYHELSEWRVKGTDNDPAYDFLDNKIAVLTVKNDLKKYFCLLTEQTFHKTLESKKISFVIFYLPWEKESLKNAKHLIELAKAWADNKASQPFALLNCFDYSDFCSNKLNINQYPLFRFYKGDEIIEELSYVPGFEVFMDYFTTYLSENPIELKDDQDVHIFLRDGFHIKDETIINRLALMETRMDRGIQLGVSNRLVLYLENASEEQRTFIELLMEKMLFGVVNCESTPELCPCETLCLKIKHTEEVLGQMLVTETIHTLDDGCLIDPHESAKKLIEFVDKHSKQKISNYKNDGLQIRDECLNVLLMSSNDDKDLGNVVRTFYKLSTSILSSDVNFYYLDISNKEDPLKGLLIKNSHSVISPALVLVKFDNSKIKKIKYDNNLTDYAQLDQFIRKYSGLKKSDEWISIQLDQNEFYSHDEL